MSNIYYTYILTNKYNTVFYTGITNNLIKRVWEHKEKSVKGFTQKYNINKLVYFEEYTTPIEAITREKQIKGWLRSKKIDLIKKRNSDYKDLYFKIIK